MRRRTRVKKAEIRRKGYIRGKPNLGSYEQM
jgi:hypothetical protein